MTDARYPERWLTDKRVLRLSDPAHRLFVTGYAWAVSNRTDGVLLGDDLELMPRVNASYAQELVEAGLWAYDGERWFLVDFDTTQTSKAQLEGLEHRRKLDRDRAQQYRERKRTSRDSSRDDKGQARQGQDRTGTEGEGVEVSDSTEDDWPTPAVPGARQFAIFARVGSENTTP